MNNKYSETQLSNYYFYVWSDMHYDDCQKILKQRILRKKMSEIKAAKKLRKKNKKLLQDENQNKIDENKIDENQNKIDEMIVSDDVSHFEISEERASVEHSSLERSSDLSCE